MKYKKATLTFLLLVKNFIIAERPSIPILSELSPIFSKGQNIMPKNSFTHYNYLFHTDGEKGFENTTLLEDFIWAPLERFSILLGFPITRLKAPGQNVVGLNDIFIQTETALYIHSEEKFYTYTSLLLGSFLPTSKGGLGRETYSFYFGGQMNYNMEHLYAYGVFQFIPTTKKEENKFGPTLFYEGGIGTPLIYRNNFLGAFILCFNGIYSTGEKVNAILEASTAGNTIFLGPLIQIMTNHIKIQVGFQYPIVDTPFSPQPKQKFRLGIGISYFLVFD